MAIEDGKKDYWLGAEGFFCLEEGNLLQEFAAGKKCLEIGSYKGRSAVCMAGVADSVLCIDPFTAMDDGQTHATEKTTFSKFLETISPFSNIHYIVGRTVPHVPELPDNSFDLVFIDGDHQYGSVKKDTIASWSKLKDDGFIAYHDYEGWEGVTRTVREAFNLEGMKRAGSLVIFAKKDGDISKIMKGDGEDGGTN